MQILAIVTGEYGRRHVENVRAHAPADWEVEAWTAPPVLPPIVDDPGEFVPASLPPADLVLAFGEHRGVAELVPEVVRVTGAGAVVAPVDREEWLPRGLARQLRGWLADAGVSCVTPKPLCSLTETHYNVRQHREAYDDTLIAAFARRFGRPGLRITVDPDARIVDGAAVTRDAVCGCARFVARGLVGIPVDEAEEKAGLLHHHFPCLASMGKDPDFNDTLLHVSGNLMKETVAEQIKPYRNVAYATPGILST